MDDAVRIAFDAGLPYAGLRDFSPDPRLWRYVPLDEARELRLVPLTRVGRVLHLAAAAPDCDLSALRARSPDLRVQLHIAAEHELRAALARASDPVS